MINTKNAEEGIGAPDSNTQFTDMSSDGKNVTAPKGRMDELPEVETSGTMDLRSINLDELFKEENGLRVITNEPIFEFEGHVFFTTILKTTVNLPEQSKDPNHTPLPERVSKLIAFYGFCSGIAYTPLTLTTKNGSVTSNTITDKSARSKCTLADCTTIENTNQNYAVLLCSKEVVKCGPLDHTSPEIRAHFLPSKEGVGPQNEIKNKFNYYIKLSHELEYVVAACFVLGSYLFPLFSYFGYLIVTGEKGAGKGTCLDLLYRMCWNPTKKYISATEAVLFRTIQDQRPTLLIDEYHRAIRNESSGNAIISILESGYEKDGAVPRMESAPNGTYKKMEYPVYCPKAIVTREPVEADDKGIKITVPKVTGDVLYAKRKIEMETDPFFEKIRVEIMKWIPYHDKEILNIYKSIEPSCRLGGRDFQVWAPLLSIAKIAFPEQYEELYKFAETSVATKSSDNNEKETLVLRALHYLYNSGELEDGGNRVPRETSYRVSNKQIKGALNDLEFDELHHNAIKSALENLKLVGKHENGYYIKKYKLLTLFKERGFIKSSNSDSDEEELKAKAMDPSEPGALEASEELIQRQFRKERPNYGDLDNKTLVEYCKVRDPQALDEYEKRQDAGVI